MRKIILSATFAAILFFVACGTDEPVNKVKIDTTGGTKKGLTVSEPLDAQPHKVKQQDSIFNGPYEERYDNGVIYMRGEVAGGMRAGQWITFYQDGKEWSRGTYKAGFREGYGVSYWQNGQKSSEGNYKGDKMVGKWKFWSEEGKLVEKDFGGRE